jgi:hypothetical protein
MGAWIGVDFDGTLAMYPSEDGWPLPGSPIPLMLQRVKNWLHLGHEVRIVTARVSDASSRRRHVALLEGWCLTHLGVILPITHEKDFEMIELWDDRAIQVIPNTGLRADGKDDPSEKI